MKDLRHRLLNKNLPVRWQKKPVDKCFVLNVERWNKNFRDWQITRI
jgi:hypothetical protein